MQPSAVRGFLYVLLSVCIWSGWYVASRLSVKGTLGPGDLTELRFLVGGLVLLPVVIRRGFVLGREGFLGGLALMLLMGAPNTFFALSGMRFAPVSHAVTLTYGSMLLCATLIGILKLKEPTSPLRMCGVASILGGTITLIASHPSGTNPHQWVAYALFITCGMMWALYTVLIRVWKADPLHATALVCVWSMLLYTPIYLFFAPHQMAWANGREVLFQSVYQGVISAALAFVAFNRGVRILGVSRASSILPLVPVIASLLAVLFLHEAPSLVEWGGIAAVSVGVLFASGILSERG